MIITEKKCSKCKIVKAISEFRNSPSEKDGHSYNCKNCEREYQRQYQKTEKSKSYHKKWEIANKGIQLWNYVSGTKRLNRE